ncbi:MAG: hypothetical protein L6V93_02065 [Clostridiales bacterium]|nr:MAG: hypothetical protein L6V93_02065 [Clostridiales bacterium]
MNESKNISDYDIILLPYIAEIIASDKLTDDQKRTSAPRNIQAPKYS